MANTKSKLVLSNDIFNQVKDIAYQTDVETGVRLVGVIEEDRYIVLRVIGPGEGAVQLPYDYECDNDYAEKVFNKLLKENRNLKWLGELHVHPRGFPFLSSTDRRTAKEVITGTDECLHPEKLIIGVMQRVPESIRIYPILFTRENLNGYRMEVICDLHEKPERKRSAFRKVRVYYRLWKRRLRHRRGAGKNGHRQVDVD